MTFLFMLSVEGMQLNYSFKGFYFSNNNFYMGKDFNENILKAQRIFNKKKNQRTVLFL